MDGPELPRIAYSERPEHTPRVNYPIYSPKPGREVEVVILSESLIGVYTHYYEGRTEPCLAEREVCRGCQGGIDRRWKGYVGCWDRRKGRLCLAEVTREAYLRCPQFELWKGRLRGKTLKMVRNGETRNARVTAVLGEWTGPIEKLPPALNVVSALERIWFTEAGQQTRKDALQNAPPGPDEPGVIQVNLYPPGGPYDV